MGESLENRMKEYEDVTRYKLSRKSYILGRIDGNAFKNYTKNLKRPFDEGFVEDMNSTAIYLCKKIQNMKFAFVQSDEISLFIHEESQDTQPWFGNILHKMDSIAASKATSEFNRCRYERTFIEFDAEIANFKITPKDLLNIQKRAEFDARFWTVPSAIEVYNTFLWRQRDAEKNAISAVAQAHFSHKLLEGVNGLKKKEMLLEKGIDFNNFDLGLQRGRFIERVTYINGKKGKLIKNEDGPTQYVHYDEIYKDWNLLPELLETDVVRSNWEIVTAPAFSADPEFLMNRIQNK